MLRALMRLLGPVFAKEMVEIARRFRYYIGRSVYGLGMLIFAAIGYENYRWRIEYYGFNSRVLAEMANGIFEAVSVLQYLSIYLLVPMFLGGAVARERESGTLDLLFTTHLTDRQIILGKLFSRLVTLGMIAASGLPVIMIIGFLGGIDLNAVIRTEMATAANALFVAAVTMHASVQARSALGAMLRVWFWLALYLLAFPFLIAAATRGSQDVFQFFCFINPVFLALVSTNHDVYERFISDAGYIGYFGLYVFPIIISIFLLWRAIVQLRQELPPLPPRRRSEAPQPANSAYIKEGSRHRSLTEVANPLWQRARLVLVFDREGYVRRIQRVGVLLTIGFFVIVAIVSHMDLNEDGLGVVFGGLSALVAALLLCIIASCSVISDRNRGMFELILTTPISRKSLVFGTYMAVYEHLKLGIFWPIVMAAVFMLTTSVNPAGMIAFSLTWLVHVAFIIVAGVGCSMASRNTAFATVPFLVGIVALCLGSLFFAALDEAAGIVLYGTLFLTGVAGLVLCYFQANSVSYALMVFGLFGTVAGLATVPIHEEWGDEAPFSMNPFFWTIVSLIRRFPDDSPYTSHATMVCQITYPIAILLYTAWLSQWIVANTDRLVGRHNRRPSLFTYLLPWVDEPEDDPAFNELAPSHLDADATALAPSHEAAEAAWLHP